MATRRTISVRKGGGGQVCSQRCAPRPRRSTHLTAAGALEMDEEEEEEEETSLQEVQAVAKMIRRDLDQVLSSISSPQAALTATLGVPCIPTPFNARPSLTHNTPQHYTPLKIAPTANYPKVRFECPYCGKVWDQNSGGIQCHIKTCYQKKYSNKTGKKVTTTFLPDHISPDHIITSHHRLITSSHDLSRTTLTATCMGPGARIHHTWTRMRACHTCTEHTWAAATAWS